MPGDGERDGHGDGGGERRRRLGQLEVLLVDHHDSFTFNLAHLVAAHTGRLPAVVQADALAGAALAAVLDHPPDAVILSPGPGTPEAPADVGASPELLARLPATPMLGVCLGHQLMARAFGARVVPAPRPMHGRLSPVHHHGRGLFAGLPDPLQVVRYHSLVVASDSLLPPLEATAWSAPERDEPPLLMALAHRERPLWGVQFHPESILSQGGAQLVANFLGLACALQQERPVPPRRRRPPVAAPPLARRPAPARLPAGIVEREVPWIDPEQAFVACHQHAATAFWLDGNQRYSFLGEAGRERLEVRGLRLERRTVGAPGELVEVAEGDPFERLGELLVQRSIDPHPDWPFRAGYVGWLGYELARFAAPGVSRELPPSPSSAPPDALLMLADRVLCLDRVERRARLCALVHAGQDEAAARAWLDEEQARLAAAPVLAAPRSPAANGAALRFELALGPAAYREAVARIHRLLARGETYEICLTTQARARLDPPPEPGWPLALHRMLRRTNPAPWSSFLRFPGGAVVSASPERFVRLDAAGAIESRPIKGTRRRGADPEEDQRLRRELVQSEKDRAENLMIVDLVRHDLGRVCRPGSVEVPSLMAVEEHPAVLQLVSRVRGQLLPGVAPLAAVRALFPGGSMTGAPKVRALSIIAALEGAPRGIYSGAIGWLGLDGALDLAMAIRTAVVRPGEVSLGIGGAVVALSRADDELEEALLKGRALAAAIASALGRPLAADDPLRQLD